MNQIKDENMKYSHIKQNFIERFFNKNFRYAWGYSKNAIIDKFETFCPFPYSYDTKTDILTIDLGDNVVLTFNFVWEKREHEHKLTKKIHTTYRLIEIS